MQSWLWNEAWRRAINIVRGWEGDDNVERRELYQRLVCREMKGAEGIS